MELSSLDDDIELLNILPKKSIKILKMSLSSSLTASKITIFTVYVPQIHLKWQQKLLFSLR